MNTVPRIANAVSILLVAVSTCAVCRPTVDNVRVGQRPGTKLVDIDFDVHGVTSLVAVGLEVSSDGGTTWEIPSVSSTGAIGGGVSPNANLRITWNAGLDWNTNSASTLMFRVSVDDNSPALSEFAKIPKIRFQMGDSFNEGEAAERPVHAVTASPFYIGKYEVTKALWDSVAQWGATHGYPDLPVGSGNAPTHPVGSVSWYSVVKWCNARSEMDGLIPCYYTDSSKTEIVRSGQIPVSNAMVMWSANGYRIPTEAEWEGAARGGMEGNRMPWGNTISHGQANYYSNPSNSYDVSSTRLWHPVYGPSAAPVGSFPANAFGVFDLMGNVKEWAWDSFGSSYYSSSPATDPRGPSSGAGGRANRGGSWDNDSDQTRNSWREPQAAGYSSASIGFRLARVPIVVAESAAPVDTSRWVINLSATNGEVSGAGLYSDGIVAQLAASPHPGYLFSAWSGSVAGAANPISIPMDSDKVVVASFMPDPNDNDDDGVTNYEEIVIRGTNPESPDSDNDGVNDKIDAFPNNSGEAIDTDGDGMGNNADTDDDGDGYSDADELAIHHTNPNRADSDGDGLSDPSEIDIHHTNPNVADTDTDGLRDGEETATHHTNPLAGDTDGDGFLDGYEVSTGKSPLDAQDKPALLAEARTAVEFTFPSAIGKTYRIEDSHDLVTWSVVENGIAGNGGVIQRFYSTRGQAKRYFRVEQVAP